MEMWKEITDSEGKYFVSNLGNVKSNKTLLKYNKDGKGYARIKISNLKTIKVHREVAKAFIPNPNNLPQVNHIDCNKLNNNVENLEWVTNKENMTKAVANGLYDYSIAKLQQYNQDSRKPIVAINIVTQEKKRYNSIRDAERELNTRHITDVLKGKRSKANGFFFKYLTQER